MKSAIIMAAGKGTRMHSEPVSYTHLNESTAEMR